MLLNLKKNNLTSIICLPLSNLWSDWLKNVTSRDLSGACPPRPPHQNFCSVAQLFAALHYNNHSNPRFKTYLYYNFSEPLSIAFSSTRIGLSVVKFCCVERFILHNLAFALTHLHALKSKLYPFFFLFFLNSSALIIMDCCISCVRNSAVPDKRLCTPCLVFYPLRYITFIRH